MTNSEQELHSKQVTKKSYHRRELQTQNSFLKLHRSSENLGIDFENGM